MVTVRAEAGAGGWSCEVGVEHGGERTKHEVRVSRAELTRWGRGDQREDVEDLVARSFAFLLEREPPGSILPRFDLSAIERYFPEYDQEINR